MAAVMEFGRYIRRIAACLENQANRDMNAKNLTVSQFHLLMVLHRREGGALRMKELEAAVHAAQSTVAGLVSRMEDKGLVQCETDPGDRRVKVVRLTRKGEEMAGECIDGFRAVNARLLSPLTAEERDTLFRLLGRISDGLEPGADRRPPVPRKG